MELTGSFRSGAVIGFVPVFGVAVLCNEVVRGPSGGIIYQLGPFIAHSTEPGGDGDTHISRLCQFDVEDLIEERNALQREVFPALSKLCEAHGARFQAVDLRWGVPDEAVFGQKMMEICLAEVERCQQTGIKPNFLVLLGDRYGTSPLPARIEAQEFETVLSGIRGDEARALAESWYQRDDNAVPPEYLLKPRTGEFVEKARWEEVEQTLQEVLRQAAHAVLMLARAAWRDLETSSVQPGQSLNYPSAWSPWCLRFVCGFFRILPHSAEVSPLFSLFAIALGVS